MRNISLGRTHTDEVKRLMSENRKGENNPFFGKKHNPETIEKFKEIASNREYLPVPGLEVEITDIETKITTVYNSIRKAAAFINSDIKTILRREKSQIEMGINTPYRKKYIINIKRD
jgi:group I intron endonuclease